METHLENVPDHVDARKVRQALRSYGKKLRLPEPIAVTVRWVKSACKTDLAELQCDGPQWFEIELNSRYRGYTVYHTLAHEMVHVRQWARGDLKDGPEGRVLWKKRVRVWDTEAFSYWDSPWEVEARGLEQSLYQRFLKDYGYTWRDLQARKAA